MNLILKTIHASLVCSVLLLAVPARAQITPDTTLGSEASRLAPNQIINSASADRIDGGAVRGSNLFHSFSQFNIHDGQRVYFSNPIGVQNILTRVTGIEASNILGTLGVDGVANLFLINPNGILFGKDASLDVQGSFVGTTANGLQFGNQGNFSATNTDIPALLTIQPSALFFNQINQNAAIQNNSVASAGIDPAGFDVFGLRVPDGKSLLLVGGNVSMDGGQLNAYGGRVELGGLAEVGNINLLFDGNNLRLEFPKNVTRASVSLTNQAFVYVEGAGGSDIAVNARNIEILGGSRLVAGIGQGLGTPETIAGDITLQATGEIEVADSQSAIINLVREGSKGNGGNITIDAGSFKLRDGAELETSTYGQGNAGNVTVTATGAVSLAGADIFSAVEAEGVGKGGNIDINAATLTLRDSAQLLTITRSASDTQPAGRGNAGNVNVKVTGVVDIAGEKNGFNSAIFSSVETGTEGNGGNITIDAGSFKLRDGALLDARTENNNRGGNITVNANVFETLNGGQLTTTTSSNGRAGKITVNATDKLIISGSDPNYNDRLTNLSIRIENIGANSGFFVSSTGSGITGDIEVNSPKITINNQGKLNAESASSNGGNIKLNSDLFLLCRGSEITTNAGKASSGGDGGNININSRFIIAVPIENSDNISANAYTGIGGNVNISAQSILGITPASRTTPNSDITASSEFGVQGQIALAQPNVDPTQGILSLPTQIVNVSNQIDQLCPRGVEAFRRPLNKFIVTGRGSLPPNPLQPMPGKLNNRQLATLESNIHSQQTLRRVDSRNIETKPTSSIIEAQGWIKNADGTIALVTAVPTATLNNRPSVPTCPVSN